MSLAGDRTLDVWDREVTWDMVVDVKRVLIDQLYLSEWRCVTRARKRFNFLSAKLEVYKTSESNSIKLGWLGVERPSVREL